ncbi:MAG: SET domain-containing protein [Actinomycetota bacterium]
MSSKNGKAKQPLSKSWIDVPPVRVGPARGKGRGVYATRKIRKGEVIERSPVIVISKPQWKHAQKTIIDDYAFDWGDKRDHAAVVLGYGSLYNHSKKANARFIDRPGQKVYEFIALRDIEEGEEICTNYNGDPEDLSPLWFETE